MSDGCWLSSGGPCGHCPHCLRAENARLREALISISHSPWHGRESSGYALAIANDALGASDFITTELLEAWRRDGDVANAACVFAFFLGLLGGTIRHCEACNLKAAEIIEQRKESA